MLSEITLISNNYGKKYDGIGKFAKAIFSKFPNYGCNVVVNTAELNHPNFFQKLLDFKMINVIITLISNIKKNQVRTQAIIIEYPFIDCNIFLIFVIKKLSNLCKKKKIPIVLSLHEYDRVNFIRKYIIRYLIKKSDILFVTNDEILRSLSHKPSLVYLRQIPSNVPCNISCNQNIKKNLDEFVFFGLINKTKAFDEMISGWKKFFLSEKNANLKLHIISASIMNEKVINSFEKYNIIFHYNLPDDETNKLLNNCAFGILPIKPYIDEKNSTFKTMLFNFIFCIGKFENDFICKNHLYVENLDELSSDLFFKSFTKCYKYNFIELEPFLKNNHQIALKKYSVEGASKDYYDKLVEGVGTYAQENKK